MRRHARSSGRAKRRTPRSASGTAGGTYGTAVPDGAVATLIRPGTRAASAVSAVFIVSSEGVVSWPGPIAPLASRSSSRRASGAQPAICVPAHHVTVW